MIRFHGPLADTRTGEREHTMAARSQADAHVHDQAVSHTQAHAPREAAAPPGSTGKAGGENFPVGSFLLPRHLRPHVAAFYGFARSADDIADDPDLPAVEKVERLDAFENALLRGSAAPELAPADHLHHSLAKTGVSNRHGRDLLSAFRQDVGQTRYPTIEALIDYCNRSAAPVGRYLLELHGEEPAMLTISDPLCNALQIINHMQDCQDDFRQMDRVYLPTDWLQAAGIDEAALDAAATPPALRRVLDQCLDTCEGLLLQAAPFPGRLRSHRLGAESAVILALAKRLVADLRAGDPLRDRIVLSRPVAAMVAVSAATGFGLRLISGRRA